MNKFKRPLGVHLFSTCIFLMLSGTLLIINMMQNEVILMSLFGLGLISSLFVAILIGLDLYREDTKQIEGKIISIEPNIINVLKSDGGIRKVRVSTKEETQQYKVNQKIVLVLSKRAGVLNRIIADVEI